MNDNIPSTHLEDINKFVEACYALPLPLEQIQIITSLGSNMMLSYGDYIFNCLSSNLTTQQ